MRRMKHTLEHLKADERGATIVFVAITIVVLMALTAFAIDYARIYDERRQLQVGAEAAALAIAEDCVRIGCATGYDEYAVAEGYADANVRDGLAWVQNVDLDLAAAQVTVTAATEDPGGDHFFDTIFARVLGYDGLTVHADATVAWGPVSLPPTIPLIISTCEWNKDAPGWPDGETDDDGDGIPDALYPESPLPPLGDDGKPSTSFATVLFHDGNTTEDCNAQAGQDTDGDGRLAGGFGWLETEGDCIPEIRGEPEYDGDGNIVGYNWVANDPGASPSTGCSAAELKELILGNDSVLIPIFDDLDGVGAGSQYHIRGFAGFYVLGYNFGGQYKEYRDPLKKAPCKGDERCIAGYFVEKTITFGDIGGPPSGITVIKLTG